MILAEPYSDVVAQHGEGPVWDPTDESLALVDMLRGDVVVVDGSHIDRRHVGRVAAAIRPRSQGGWVLGVEQGFALAGRSFTEPSHLPPLWSDTDLRMNDGACDPYGAFLCGSLSTSGRPGAGALYRMTSDHEVKEVLGQITTSNGLGWSLDGSRAYFIDSATQRLDEYRYDETGGFSDQRPLARIPVADGIPDGLTVDAEGGVWVALYGGSAVVRYAPDGRLTHRVRVPVSQPTACTFGGPGLATLLVTTSSLGLERGSEPLAGAVFAVVPGVVGQPSQAFGG
ncbi:SMP-30/gluconolactonase/LRE family protein [Asanoa sp. NPDC049573]|uniref:SMP-30/gluconolactonase/LRE family protein n=1 Tax=Asanoa sp. NPDC049573 TaxID=3155396 RepID=UPI00342928FD